MASGRPAHETTSRQDGFVLVAALWIVAALAALVVIFSEHVSTSARALRLADDALQAEALISAGTELAAYRLLAVKEADRPRRGDFRVTLAGHEILVSFLTEAARIDLNGAPKEMIANLFVTLGATPEAANDYAARVVAWRSKPQGQAAAQAEEALYTSAGRSYGPRLAPFAHVDELALVLGPPAWLVARAMPFVTVFNATPGIDPIVAPPQVVAALPGMTPLILKDFLASREAMGADPAALSQALGPAAAAATTAKSKAWRLHIVATTVNGLRKAADVVIAPAGGDEPYQLLAQIDAGPQDREWRVARRKP